MALTVFILLLSLSLNAVLVWNVRKLLQEIAPLYERTEELANSLEEFCVHVESVYELPSFYGDQTIKDLLEHTKDMSDEANQFRDSFVFEAGGEIGFEETETQTEE